MKNFIYKIFILVFIFVTPQIYSSDIQSILKKSVGGDKAVEKIQSLESIHFTGKVNMNGTVGSFDYICKPPNKSLLTLSFKDFSVVQGYDGATAWQKDLTGQKTELVGNIKTELLSSLYLICYSYLFDDSLNNKALLNDTTINGESYNQIIFVPFPKDTIKAFYNVKTGNLEIIKTYQNMTEVTTFESSYQTVEHILIPFEVQTFELKFNFRTTQTIEKVTFNEPFHDSLFKFQKRDEANYRFSSQDSINIKFEYQNNHIFLPVTLSGSKKVYMLLDSGAGTSVIHLPIAQALNLDTVITIPAVGVSGYTNTQLVKTDSMQISELTLYNQIVGSLDLEKIVSRKINKVQFGGILGNDFISQFPLLINYQTKELTIYNPKSYQAPDGGVRIPIEFYNLIPTIDAEVAGFNGKFLVDLGNSIGLILNDHFVSSHKFDKKIRNKLWRDHLIGGVGGAASGFEAVIDSFRLGDTMLNNIDVYLPFDSTESLGFKEIDGNIGNVQLQNFRLFFDYIKQEIILYNK